MNVRNCHYGESLVSQQHGQTRKERKLLGGSSLQIPLCMVSRTSMEARCSLKDGRKEEDGVEAEQDPTLEEEMARMQDGGWLTESPAW